MNHLNEIKEKSDKIVSEAGWVGDIEESQDIEVLAGQLVAHLITVHLWRTI